MVSYLEEASQPHLCGISMTVPVARHAADHPPGVALKTYLRPFAAGNDCIEPRIA